MALVVVLAACHLGEDRAGWEKFVTDTTKAEPHRWSAGDTAALVQFGYDYCAQRDPARSKPGPDDRVVDRLWAGLVSHGIPVDQADGPQFARMLASVAQKKLCPVGL
ncbi:MAG TPA: hypothetical protein VME40_10130 [Caulobacteraceae bacterium]|nr:hypothetical protein [Caulobacteraceae bacterium]